MMTPPQDSVIPSPQGSLLPPTGTPPTIPPKPLTPGGTVNLGGGPWKTLEEKYNEQGYLEPGDYPWMTMQLPKWIEEAMSKRPGR